MLITKISLIKINELKKLQHISLFTIIVVVLLFFMHTALGDLTVYSSKSNYDWRDKWMGVNSEGGSVVTTTETSLAVLDDYAGIGL